MMSDMFQLLKKQAQCDSLVLDLVQGMACTLGYMQDVEQFAGLPQLKEAIDNVRFLIEQTSNFIHKWHASREGLGSWYLCLGFLRTYRIIH
jgi:homoaconitase/3-isopropylmalate dehydratase large subunit